MVIVVWLVNKDDEMKLTLELDAEQVDDIVVAVLKDQYAGLDIDSSVPLFSYDKEENIKEIVKLKEAFKTVLEYYGETV